MDFNDFLVRDAKTTPGRLESERRQTIARAFYELLHVASHNQCKLRQDGQTAANPFGSIKITQLSSAVPAR